MSKENIENMYGNKERTEINIPVDENSKLEIDLYAHISMDNYNFGELGLEGRDMSNYNHSNHHLLGKVKVTIDFSSVDTEVDVRGILIKQVKEKIKELDASHIASRSELTVKLSKLLAIEDKS